jgi:two-component system, LuxR family, sensor kinase FixL
MKSPGSSDQVAADSSFRDMMEHLPIAAIWIRGGRLHFNRAAESVCGWRAGSLPTIGDWFGACYGGDKEAARQRYEHLRSTRFSHCLSEQVRGADGVGRSLEIAVYPIEMGEIWLIWPTGESREIIGAIKENEYRLRAVLDSTLDAIVTIDHEGVIMDANPATLKMFGYRLDELIGSNVSVFMPSPHREQHGNYVSRYLETGEARIIGIGREVRGVRKDGSVFPLELAVSRIDHLGMFCGIMRDITERRQIEERVIHAVVDERRRSAQDLHDGLGSMLTAIHLRINSLARSLAAAGSGLAEEAGTVAGLVKKAVSQTRAIARGMDPVGPEPQDLMTSLAEMVNEVNMISGIECEFRCPEPVLIDGMAVCNQLYRIAQEAANNGIKHAECSRIVVSLVRRNGEVVLSVADNGRGIKHEDFNAAGSGLKFMRYRAITVGGTFSISPGSESGTIVTCVVPLQTSGTMPGGGDLVPAPGRQSTGGGTAPVGGKEQP